VSIKQAGDKMSIRNYRGIEKQNLEAKSASSSIPQAEGMPNELKSG
jgi:hypothetical protein